MKLKVICHEKQIILKLLNGHVGKRKYEPITFGSCFNKKKHKKNKKVLEKKKSQRCNS